MPIASAISTDHRKVPVREVVQLDHSSRASSLRSQSTIQSAQLASTTDPPDYSSRKQHSTVGETSEDDFQEHTLRRARSSMRSGFASISSGQQPSPPHSLQGEFGRIREACSDVVDDERMQIFILFLVMVNSIMFGVATFPIIKDFPERVTAFEVCDLWFLIIFTIEIVMSLIANGRKYFKNGWQCFDFFIVTLSWISIEVHTLRAFRVFRALRLITRVEILRNVVVALFSIVPQLTAIVFLLVLVLYIFSVMFTELFKYLHEDGHTETNYFGRLDLTFFTLFQILCLDEWSGIALEVMNVYHWSWVLFIGFVTMSAFVVINLFIAVICEAVHVLRTAERAMLFGFSEGDESSCGEICHVDRGFGMTEEQIEEKVHEMQKMLDEMVETQESMAQTIQFLSLALLPQLQLHDLSEGEEEESQVTEDNQDFFLIESCQTT